jgi:hypothetical protein
MPSLLPPDAELIDYPAQAIFLLDWMEFTLSKTITKIDTTDTNVFATRDVM